MSMIYVVPAAGGRVRQPERQSRVMPEAGAWVPNDTHYQRLLATGDVAHGIAPEKAEKPAASAGEPARLATETGRSNRRAPVSEE